MVYCDFGVKFLNNSYGKFGLRILAVSINLLEQFFFFFSGAVWLEGKSNDYEPEVSILTRYMYMTT